MKKNLVLKTIILLFLCCKCYETQAQPDLQTELSFNLGQLVTAEPDSIFRAYLSIAIGSDVQPESIRLVMQDSSVIIFDQQFTVTSLPDTISANAWKEGNKIHIDIPDYNPFRKRNYLVELLGENGHLLLQIEKEF